MYKIPIKWQVLYEITLIIKVHRFAERNANPGTVLMVDKTEAMNLDLPDVETRHWVGEYARKMKGFERGEKGAIRIPICEGRSNNHAEISGGLSKTNLYPFPDSV